MLAEAQRITSSPRRLMAQMTGASLMTSGRVPKQSGCAWQAFPDFRAEHDSRHSIRQRSNQGFYDYVPLDFHSNAVP